MPEMTYRILGSSALRVSQLCLGTMTFGVDHPMASIDAASAEATMARFLDVGGNFVDTANMYTAGQSETLIGNIIHPYRHKIVLATKCGHSMSPQDPNAAGMHRKNIVQALEKSLSRLRMDYIDLYWIHSWDRFTKTDEALRALDDLVGAGKVLHIGASNTSAWRIAEANAKASCRTLTPFSAVQVQYNLIDRTAENEIIPMARANDVAVLAWSPLAMGALTGKYLDRGETGRLSEGSRFLNDSARQIVRGVVDEAAQAGCKPSQIALAWLLKKDCLPIIGGSNPSHFEDAFAALDVQLDEHQLARLDALSAPPPNQPGALFPGIDRMVYGEVVSRITP